MARPCSLCCSPKSAEVGAAIIAGLPDSAVAQQYGFSRAAVQRHRQNHVLAPAQQIAAITGKGQSAVQQRAVIASATADDPRVWLALDAITKDIKKVHDRLDNAADEAAAAKQHVALASVSGQLIRTNELRAKLGGVGQDKETPAGGFSLRIFLDGGEKASLVIEGGTAEPVDGDVVEIH